MGGGDRGRIRKGRIGHDAISGEAGLVLTWDPGPGRRERKFQCKRGSVGAERKVNHKKERETERRTRGSKGGKSGKGESLRGSYHPFCLSFCAFP